MQITVDLGLIAVALVAIGAIIIYVRESRSRKKEGALQDALQADIARLEADAEAFQQELAVRSGEGIQDAPPLPTTHEVIIKLNAAGNFQLRTKENERPGLVSVRPGDILVWDTGGTMAMFQFPRVPLFNELRTFTERREPGERLWLTVSTRAVPGRYVYAIYCRRGGFEGFVEEGTPPQIEVTD